MHVSLAMSLIAFLAALVALVGTLTLAWKLRQARARMRRYEWNEWFVRNAAECTRIDPSRPYLVALAYAASLAPDLRTLAEDCTDIAEREELPEGLRNAAKSIVQELHAPERPWVAWTRDKGTPFHPGAQVFAYREALVTALTCIPGGIVLPPPLDLPET